MNQPEINLQAVNLHYASVAFKERSLKSLLSRPFGKSGAREIKDVHALKNITLEIKGGEENVIAKIDGEKYTYDKYLPTHVDAFNDPLIDNKDSKNRYRADVLIEDYAEKLNLKARNGQWD